MNEPSADPTSDASSRGLYLDSWKEIAAYLKRDIRTVQRWEKREGLPVHRHQHDERGTAYAYSAEIDRWLGWSQPTDRAATRLRVTAPPGSADGMVATDGRAGIHETIPRTLATGCLRDGELHRCSGRSPRSPWSSRPWRSGVGAPLARRAPSRRCRSSSPLRRSFPGMGAGHGLVT